jgi:hypothetical protein
MPEPLPVRVRQLARRLAIGLFFDRWPTWATASLLAGGCVALVCRLFYPGAAWMLHWLWVTPLVAAVPIAILCVVRSYRPAEVVAVADWLGGGRGTLLTMFERNDASWSESAHVRTAATFPLPRLQPWRRLAPVLPAAAFLGVALWLPQRVPADGSSAVLADEIAADLAAAVVQLQQQNLITPEEEQRLEEEIERIRRGAQERVDASSWEAADAVREQVVAGLSAKQDAVKWAEEALARYAAAAGGAAEGASTAAHSAELSKALERLAKSGMLAGAPADLQRLAASGKLPADPAQLREVTAALAKHLADMQGRFGDLAQLGRGFGRFDPAEFPVATADNQDGDGRPGRGGVDRGRGDAELTWGKETQPFDRFKAQPLPPGAARSPDDWTPVVTLPGAPLESPGSRAQAATRQYAAAAGQAAWRRSLAPRHQSAVRKYFEK